MAIRFRPGRKAPWQCYWNNPLSGKRECANFLTELEAKKHDSLIKHRLQFERESFRKEDDEKTDNTLTLEMVFSAYVADKKPKAKTFISQLSAMKRVAPLFPSQVITEITKKDIQDAMQKMASRGIKNVSIISYFAYLRAVLYWAAEQGLCDRVSFPRPPKYDGDRIIPPTPDELAAIIENASPHIQRVCIIGSQFGVRIGQSELGKLTWADVDLSRMVLRVHAADKNPNCPWREVPIKESLIPIFQQWKEEDAAYPKCHLIHIYGKPVINMHKAWHNALTRAGITRRIRLYDLRHAFATEAIAGGADIGTVASLMGHANPNMILKHYQFVTDRQKQHAVEALPDVQYVPNAMCPRFQKPKIAN